MCLLFTGCFEKNLPLESECVLWETCEINLEQKIQDTEEELSVYTWMFHADFVDDKYVWGLSITWNACRKLKVLRWETWYIYKYTFDIWCHMDDMLYQNSSMTFTSPILINWESDFVSWNSKWDNVPFIRVDSIGLMSYYWWASLSNPETNTTNFYMRCFNDTSIDPRFREWRVPAFTSWTMQLTTFSNKIIDMPFINHSSATQFWYWYSEQYHWDIMDQCVLQLSHTNKNTISLPFKLSWWFWDSALIIRLSNRDENSYCEHRDTEIQVSNGMTCYIYAQHVENLVDIKLWDISDMIN